MHTWLWKQTLEACIEVEPPIATRKRENMMSYSKTKYKKRCRTFCRLRGKDARVKGMYKNRCKHNYNNYSLNKEMLWSCTTLVVIVAIAHPQLL
jgi:hypothetical protein